MPHVSPSDPRDRSPARGSPGAPPPGQIVDWLKFAWATLSQVKGFTAKVKAFGRIIAILTQR
jgi:hypothetical protein